MRSQTGLKIKSIDIIYNKVLEDAFEARRREFESRSEKIRV
jgi:hypothetical protein